jgi:hypothetical protein
VSIVEIGRPKIRRRSRTRVGGGAKVLGAAVISLISYGVVIWAMSVSPMGKVSALRETSILFAAMIGSARCDAGCRIAGRRRLRASIRRLDDE